MLVRWLLNEDRPDLALQELRTIEKFHDTPEVQNLIRIAIARVALAKDQPKNNNDVSKTSGGPDGEKKPDKPMPLLTDQEINRIRIYEIDFDDPPSVTIDDAIIQALMKSYSDHPLMPASIDQRNRLFEAEPIQVARFMRRLDASELLDGIQVNEDPLSMRLFQSDFNLLPPRHVVIL